MRPKLYLSHPISGLTPDESFAYFDMMIDRLGLVFNVLNPLAGKGDTFRGAPGWTGVEQHPVTKQHAIFARDLWAVSTSDFVFVDLTWSKIVSIGCVMELGWAAMLHKHTVLALNHGNMHEHAFVLEAATVRFESADEAVEYLLEYGKETYGY